MAADGGNGSLPSGTGSKSINLGVSTTGFTWFKVKIRGSAYKPFEGYSFVNGSYQYCYDDANTSLQVGKVFRVKNSAGTVVIEGTHTGFSGTNVNFNLTINTGTPPDMLMEWGN